jgi:hypothetical protein
MQSHPWARLAPSPTWRVTAPEHAAVRVKHLGAAIGQALGGAGHAPSTIASLKSA